MWGSGSVAPLAWCLAWLSSRSQWLRLSRQGSPPITPPMIAGVLLLELLAVVGAGRGLGGEGRGGLAKPTSTGTGFSPEPDTPSLPSPPELPVAQHKHVRQPVRCGSRPPGTPSPKHEAHACAASLVLHTHPSTRSCRYWLPRHKSGQCQSQPPATSGRPEQPACAKTAARNVSDTMMSCGAASKAHPRNGARRFLIQQPVAQLAIRAVAKAGGRAVHQNSAVEVVSGTAPKQEATLLACRLQCARAHSTGWGRWASTRT